MSDFKRLDRTLIHKGHIIDYYEDTMQLPDKRQAKWDFIGHKGAAAIVPVTKEGKILMVTQYRNAIERDTLEIPAGGLNPNEDPKVAAMRELEEETGFRTEDAKHLITLYTTVAFCNEKISIYYTNQLIPSKQHLDPDEYVQVKEYELPDLIQMIFDGKIQDAKTISALLAYQKIAQQ